MRIIIGSIAWFVATLYVVYAFTLNTAAAVFSSAVQKSLHISTVQATMAVVGFIVGFAVMQIFAGYLLDKYRARYIVSAGILVLAIGNILTSQAGSLAFYTFTNFIQGIGASFAFIAAGVLIGQWFADKMFPILFGLTQTLSCVLSGVLHFFLSNQLKVHSWNQLYLWMSFFGFALCIIAFIFVKNPKGMKAAPGLSLVKAIKTVCSSGQLWLCTIGAAVAFGVLLAYGGFWYIKVQEFYNLNTDQSMVISGIIFAGVGIGTPLLGYISNLFKSRTMLIHVTLTSGVIFLLAGIYLPHFNIDTLIFIQVISFFIGFLLSGSMLFYTVVSEIMPAEVRGVALSVVNTAVFLFNSVLMFLPYVFSTSKTFYTSLWIMPAWVVVGILFLYFVKDSFHLSQQPSSKGA